jgi:hypothetical protein
MRAADSSLAAAVARVVAVASVGAFGAAALTVTSPAAPVSSVVDGRLGMAPGTQRLLATDRAMLAPTQVEPPAVRRVTAGRPGVAAPAPAKPAAHEQRPAHHRHQPWLPSGTGMWIYEWSKTDGGSAQRVVSRARQVGLSTLYLRTGSTYDGFTGGRALPALLHATRGTGVHVVAWDFPELRHPLRDARRLARAARVGRPGGGQHVSAVAPDIETPAEGTFNAAWRVRAYLSALHRHLPKGVTILTAVPWPSRYRIRDYPYATVAAHSNALVPMAYWYNNPPAMVTGRSISYLRRFHKPVQPVGQGYDGKLDVPSLRHNHLGREVPTFFRTAHRYGARAVSLWSWQAAPPTAWRALWRVRHLFGHRHRHP